MFQKLGEHTWYRSPDPYTDRPSIGFIRGRERSLLFEAGNSAAHAALLREELLSTGLPYPDFVAVSHWHWDHTFGLAAWNAVTVAGKETNERLQQLSSWQWDDASMQERIRTGEDIVFCSEMIRREYPDRSKIHVVCANVSFVDELRIDLGGVQCVLLHARGPHSSDSVICFVPEDRFLYLGDSNGKDLYGLPWHFDLREEHRLPEILDALPYDSGLVAEYEKVLNGLDFTNCIGGHAGPMTRDELYCSLVGK
jgi:glyoxylase-like metal-dependent hydrolase (beta-lactamase superfamily II)